jgi:Na+-transporting NADH:ubiquinone oxidoreductase subunit NqrD
VGESIGKAYKPWLILSLSVLVGSLVLAGVAVIAGFSSFSASSTPLWVIVLGVTAGFGGFFLLMVIAGWKSFREGQRVQVIPPGRAE